MWKVSEGGIGRRAASVAAAATLLAGSVITAGFFVLRTSAAPLRGTLTVESDRLRGEVVVRVDSLAVPHVVANSLGDAFFAQGYLHATHRLFQMEVTRRTAQGRLAEIFGPAAVGLDRLLRTLDLWGAAGRSLEALSERELELVRAYTAGINARLARSSGPPPPEFLLLGTEPEPWTSRAVVAVGKVMALDLSPWLLELDRYSARRALDGRRYSYLEAGYPPWGPTILRDSVPTPTLAGGDPVPAGRTAARTESGRAPGEPVARPPSVPPSPSGAWGVLRGGGSNAWALDGSRTSTGHPLLANDMHLGLRAPAIWYLVGLHVPEDGYEVAGLSIPGAPGVIVGYNRHLAWGFTNGIVDDMDFVVEEVEESGERYRDGGSWREFSVRRETIRVRGRSAPVVHRVRETIRGPVVSDALPGLDAPLSVAWTASGGTTELRGLLAMNRARSAREMDLAIQLFASPQQNVVYATAADTVGYRLSGTVPLRSPLRSGSYPLEEPPGGPLWLGAWPPGLMPAKRWSETGYVATANNLQAPGLHGVLGVDYPVPFRARRIVDRLATAAGWGVPEMTELQRDTRSLFADRVVGRAVAAMRRAGRGEAASRLEAWDRRVDVDSRAATLFYLWLYRLRDLVAGDEFRAAGGSGELPRHTYFPDGALLRLLEGGAADSGAALWVDDVSTPDVESLAELEERAAEDAVREARDRAWGQVHLEVHEHPLGRVPLLDALFGFQVGPVPGPGGPHTVRPDDYDRWRVLDGSAWRAPMISRYGPSQRFVAVLDPEEGNRGLFMLPTGQSGNPFSGHYRDMLPRWRAGELIPVPLDREAIRARTARVFRLSPPSED